MLFTDKKLEQRINELEGFRYRDCINLFEFAVKEDVQGVVNPTVPNEFTGWDTLKVSETWSGRDRYLWLHKRVQVPKEWEGKRILGVFDFGTTGGGNNSGFESLLYINGAPYQGVDVNHKEVFLGEKLTEEKVDFTFRLWSGLEGGGIPSPQEHKIARADLCWLDEKTDDLFYFGRMIVETLKYGNAQDPSLLSLRAALNRAVQIIDWAKLGSETFYASIAEADDHLNNEIDAMGKDAKLTIKCIGHTHIDVAWLWRLKHTREKASRSFSTVLRLMEQYDEYIFLQTQPHIYEQLKTDFPDLYEKIKERVKEGRWEVDGGMWVEADCNITSGESLTRQLLIGSKFMKEEFDKDAEYLWLPDVFGYSWALPQILKKSGIDMFMTTKISWNQYNRMPHDTFKWRGIDGTEILTHFITTTEPWSEPGSTMYTYNGRIEPKTVLGSWEAYRDKEINQELLISYGFGDGGGGVNRDMLEQRRRIDKLPGLPKLETSTAGAFFKDLKKTLRETDQYVHTWDGELYLEYHRGTYTSQAYNKKMNRRMEYLYRKAEWMTVMEAMAKSDLSKARQEELTKGWKHILTNQFHDIIPGSSIHEVYEDCVKDYEYIASIATGVITAFKEEMMEQKESVYTIWNDALFKRSGVVKITTEQIGFFTEENGTMIESVPIDGGYLLSVKEIPSMGYKTVVFVKGEENAKLTSFKMSGDTIETPFYTIVFNEVGQITRLYDKEFDTEVVKTGDRINVLQMFEDKPMCHDAWDIDIFYQEKMREITNLIERKVTENNALRMVVSFQWKYMDSVIDQEMILYREDRRIDFKTKVDCHEQHQLLKAAFPVNIRSTYATYDIQYGNVRRATHWNTSWDWAKFETVAHRFVDLSERNYGVSLLNDCKYGHDIKDNVIRISLIKTATHPDYLQDQGLHEFTYSLLPHGGDFVDANVVNEAHALNSALMVDCGRPTLSYDSFLSVDKTVVELDAVKTSEDEKYIVIRFHEFTGSKSKITLNLNEAVKAYAECDLRERPITKFTEGNVITRKVKPYEIVSYLLKI